MKIDALKESGTALTKRELVAQIASETGLTQLDVFDVVQKALDGIIDALGAGKHVEFREFGVFEVATRKARIGRNPNKPEDVVMIPVRRVVKFKPGKRMRDMLAGK
ncbi:MAG: integration host factor subunit beta [Kiritimatiellae bacterium]|jgi:nucleoid DNA-binding protein|nr:integration host factor subunit beta [Kiritimatiellia bacterium]NLF99741.1 integration host factor subunit beta [Lentisphaerota bacterium]